MYCTYVEPTYTTNEAGEQVLEKDGFYCWVKYDPSKDKLTYTVTTTNGKLNIDYALLENVVYYLQEAIALTATTPTRRSTSSAMRSPTRSWRAPR